MKRRISSDAAPLWKGFWIFFLLVLGTLLLVTDSPLFSKVGYFFGWIICFLCFWRLYKNLRTIEIDEYFMFVSDGRTSLKIPFSEIKNVRQEFIDLRNPIIFIDLKSETQFGREIKFMPYYAFRLFLAPHPVINQLRQLAKITN